MHVHLETGYYTIVNEEWHNFAVMYVPDGRGDGFVRATALPSNTITDDVKV